MAEVNEPKGARTLHVHIMQFITITRYFVTCAARMNLHPHSYHRVGKAEAIRKVIWGSEMKRRVMELPEDGTK